MWRGDRGDRPKLWRAFCNLLIIPCAVSCLPGYGDDCGGSLETGAYTLHVVDRLPPPTSDGGACLSDLAGGMDLSLDVYRVGDCDRRFKVTSQLQELESFVEGGRLPFSGISAVYSVTTVGGCHGWWHAVLLPPPIAQTQGVPCDDCVLLHRTFEPESCSSPAVTCEDRFYGPLVRVP